MQAVRYTDFSRFNSLMQSLSAIQMGANANASRVIAISVIYWKPLMALTAPSSAFPRFHLPRRRGERPAFFQRRTIAIGILKRYLLFYKKYN
jgi:hypothetical protein